MKRNKSRELFEILVVVLLPLSFIGPGFLNSMVFLMDGHRHEWLRTLLVWGGQAVAAVLFMGKVFLLWRERPEKRKMLLAGGLIPLTLGCLYVLGLLIWSNKRIIVTEMIVNECYLISMTCAVLILMVEKNLRQFLRVARIYGILLMPVALFYSIRMYVSTQDYYAVIRLGTMSYMSVAYLFLEICIFQLMIQMFFPEEHQEKRWLFKLDIALFVMSSIVISLSGTKGTIICLIFGMFLATVYDYFVRKKRTATIALLIVSVLSPVLFSLVLAPYQGTDNRVMLFLQEMFVSDDSVKVNSEEISNATSVVQKIESSEQESTPSSESDPSTPPAAYNEDAFIDVVQSGEAQMALESGIISKEEYDQVVGVMEKIYRTTTGGRKYYWACAADEISSAPLVGKGPLFFWQKYEAYPHNPFIECATDFGLPFTVALMVFAIFVLRKLIYRALHNPGIAVFLLYIMFHVPESMLNGFLYRYSTFFMYGFSIVVAFLSERYFEKEE